MSICVHPIHNEVKRDEAKIQTVVNIGIHLRLLTAVAAIPYSEVVDIYTNSSSIEELKSISLPTESEIIESEQLHAVDLCYDGIQSENPFMYFVDGAPGTGKSHYIVKLIEKLFSKEWPDYSMKVLIVTQSSASADNILQRLVKAPNQGTNFNVLRYGNEKTIHPTWKKYALSDSNYILQNGNLSFNIDLEERIFAAKKNAIKKYEGSMNDSAADALRKKYAEEIVIGSADVVIMSRDAYTDFLKDFSPCVLVDSHIDHFNRFSVCIFDDANEISEIDLLIPVMTMASNLILVGDSRNPTGHDLSLTPFTRLLEKYQKTLPRNTINFKTQYRVHPKVLDCLSKMKLNVDVNQENAESSLALKPLMIVELPSEDESLDHSTHFEAQAKFCKNIVQNIQKVKELKNLDVGVLVGNKHQKEVVHNELKSCSPETFVDKLAAYCGLEKDVIIACIPPLLFPEKFLYTAMTRAKRSVIICGDFAQFQGQETIDELLKNANRRKCFQRWDKDPAEFPFRTMRTSC